MAQARESGPRGKRGRVRRLEGRQPKTRSGAVGRPNVYDEVTARIIAELEAGTVPWVRPWDTAAAAAGLPVNAATGRHYSGINILLLWVAVVEGGYPSQSWLTFRQALAAGGAVRKGEKGTGIVYADRFVPRERNTGAGPERGPSRPGEAGQDGPDGDVKAVPFLKRFTVFNVAQCDGLPERYTVAPPPVPNIETLPRAEAVIRASGVRLRTGGGEAFYAPGPDFVQLPPSSAFFEPLDYYRIALHELTHATGHGSRLARNLAGAFGSKDYAREELVAEMGSAFLCAALGIAPSLRHADYLASWLAVLRADNRAIIRAASAASKAADWLLSCPGATPDDAAQAEARAS